jgi:hypothetical protein
MSISIQSISILDDGGSPINTADRAGMKPSPAMSGTVLGLDVSTLNVKVEVAGGGSSDLPAGITVEVRTFEPGSRRPGKSDLVAPVPITVHRQGQSTAYTTNFPLIYFDNVQNPAFATIVREGGTSDRGFRNALMSGPWATRGSGIVPDRGKSNSNGVLSKDEPDGLTLFKAGGVEVIEVAIPDYSKVDSGVGLAVSAYLRSPADIFFYSGHGAFWNGNLVRDRAMGHVYEDWLSPEDLAQSWSMHGDGSVSPVNLDVLVINGCSVLFWNQRGLAEKVPLDRGDIGLRWAKLLSKYGGPLHAILGYRYRSPADFMGGDTVAAAMAQAIVGSLGSGWDSYARKWLEINVRDQRCWGAAAFDNNGYWYINTLATEGANGTPIQAGGYDSKQKQGTIMGPFPLP